MSTGVSGPLTITGYNPRTHTVRLVGMETEHGRTAITISTDNFWKWVKEGELRQV